MSPGSLGQRLTGLRAEWADGLRLLAHQRVLRVIMIFLLVTSVGQGIMSTLFAPFVRSVLHGSDGDPDLSRPPGRRIRCIKAGFSRIYSLTARMP